MMKETITFNLMDYDEDITADKLILDESQKSHIRKIKSLHKFFESLWKEYNKAICEHYGNKKITDGTIKITSRTYCIVDENKLVELYGEDALKKVKVREVTQTFVSSI